MNRNSWGNSVVNASEMDEGRFAELVGAYGANPDRWPGSERAAAQGYLASSATARQLVAAAAGVDHVLAMAAATPIPTALQARMLADFDRVARRPSARRILRAAAEFVWPGAPAWQPAFALGMALAIGIGIAVLTPLDGRLGEGTGNNMFALDGSPDLDSGQGI